MVQANCFSAMGPEWKNAQTMVAMWIGRVVSPKGQFIPDATYGTHASIRERYSMETGQHGMKFLMKRTCGRREAVNACDCDATGPYSSPYRRTNVSRMHPV
ncbi:hypothetical protein Y032_0534g3063 [Ancylostoma ceylanicum]|uniref:Uncharacterized protein n=1 Tax=Ancylostoma ceylanicum TaxID=53326 RepID=A0A016WRW7_9BILA|nr:hypothetical protein Y032_0534g3063 [Ancylostoma ceylanicum]